MFFFITVVCLVATRHLALARKVSALDEICARGAYSFCSSSRQREAQGNVSLDVPQSSLNEASSAPAQGAAGPQPARTPATAPSLPTIAEYCVQYQYHYQYYCQNGNAKDSRVTDFCPIYAAYCTISGRVSSQQDITTTQAPELPPIKVQQFCRDNQQVANQYCFRQEIPKGVIKSCDTYLKYCMAGQQQNPSIQQVIRDNIKPCVKFQNDYVGFCVQNPTASNDKVAEFCKNYKSLCIPTTDRLGQASSQQQSQPVQPQPQLQPPPQPQLQASPTSSGGQWEPFGGNPWAGAGSPVSTLPLGNPNIITNPIGSLGPAPSAQSMPNPANPANPAQTAPDGSDGNQPTGLAANPIRWGQQTSVGQIAGFSKGTSVNPFGQVATGTSVLAGPVGLQTGRAIDFSGLPGLGLVNSLGIGKRRRRSVLTFILNGAHQY